MVATAVLDHIFAPMPPEVRQDRTLSCIRARMKGDRVHTKSMPGYRLLDRYARDLPGVERMAIFAMARTVYSYRNGQRIRSLIKRTDAEYWRVLDFQLPRGQARSPTRTSQDGVVRRGHQRHDPRQVLRRPAGRRQDASTPTASGSG